jgi:UDP-N-acetylglucosamine 2-epimerase
MRIVTVVGARPQFIKAAPVSAALSGCAEEIVVHTGQHYDDDMSGVFFRELGLAEPDHHLGVGSGSHGQQTAAMLSGIESVLLAERPDAVLVYGDTNSTLAGALAAAKLDIPVAHVEAGLRSFNRSMPEEHNRVLTDHLATWLFCPSDTAVRNLAGEGLISGVHNVGDVMLDAALHFAAVAEERSTILDQMGLSSGGYLLGTLHRAYNTDDPHRLRSIVTALSRIGEPVVFPVHPRTRLAMANLDLNEASTGIHMIDPVGYLDMLVLLQHARLVLTDSGGLQKEAFFFGVPCATLRPETEWVETVTAGWNVLVNADEDLIMAAAQRRDWPQPPPPQLYGDGCSAGRIASILTA